MRLMSLRPGVMRQTGFVVRHDEHHLLYLARPDRSAPNPGMMKWRERLFIVLSKNAMNAADFFKIPTNRVIEMGTRIEI